MNDDESPSAPQELRLLQIGHFRFPRWLAPVVGCGLGLAVGLWLPAESLFVRVVTVAVAAALGLFVGVVVWTIDFIESSADPTKAPRASVTVVLLLLTPVLCLLPVLGFVFVSYTFRRCKWLDVPDWWLAPFALTFVAAIGSTLGLVILLITGW
jgi:hypothetical protein